MGLKPLLFAGCLVACAGGPKGIPQGPPPEYERHPLPPWDGGGAMKPQGPTPGVTDAGSAAPSSGRAVSPQGSMR